MVRPKIIKEILDDSEYLNKLFESGANILAPIQYNIPEYIATSQPFDYYNIYKNIGLNYFFETVVIMGIGRFSLRNSGKYVAFVRSDDVTRDRSDTEARLDNALKVPKIVFNNLESLVEPKKKLNYIDWLNGRANNCSGASRLVSIVFSSFVVPFTCYLDTMDLRDFADSLSESELKKYTKTRSTEYYCFTAEKGRIEAAKYSKTEIELYEEIEDDLKFIGNINDNDGIVFTPHKGIPQKKNGCNLSFNPWN